MKRKMIAKGVLKKDYYDEEYYWVVNGDVQDGTRIRIDNWSKKECMNVLVPELRKFKNKNVRIVLEVLD